MDPREALRIPRPTPEAAEIILAIRNEHSNCEGRWTGVRYALAQAPREHKGRPVPDGCMSLTLVCGQCGVSGRIVVGHEIVDRLEK